MVAASDKSNVITYVSYSISIVRLVECGNVLCAFLDGVSEIYMVTS